MAVQESREPDYPATAGYVLRRRERFWLGSIIFVYAFPGSLLTLVTIGYLTGYPSVAEVIYFGLFFLLAVPCGFWMWKERAAVAGRVLLAVDEGGVYLAGPPRRIPWRETAGLVAFRSWQDGDDGAQMAVAPGGRAPRRGLPARHGGAARVQPGPVGRGAGSARREAPAGRTGHRSAHLRAGPARVGRRQDQVSRVR